MEVEDSELLIENTGTDYKDDITTKSPTTSSLQSFIQKSQKSLPFAITCSLLMMTFLFYGYSSFNASSLPFRTYVYGVERDDSYLIYTNSCKIPYVDPFTSDAKSLIKTSHYKKCLKTDDLIYQSKDDDGIKSLHINESVLNQYKKSKSGDILCCLRYVERSTDKSHVDEKIRKLDCIKFTSNITISQEHEVLHVDCSTKIGKKTKSVYEDTFSSLERNLTLVERWSNFTAERSEKPWNVVIFGIDSLSRGNLYRTMPSTAAFLKREGWLDFRGFQKIDDNTYPNLMALLIGKNRRDALATCEPGSVKRITNSCPFIWKKYHDFGYITAYAEDFIPFDTFGRPNHKGFGDTPTDHYLKPLFLMGEKRLNLGSGLHTECVGSRTTGEHIIKYAEDFANAYRNESFFGFFWSNSYSHQDMNVPRIMDERVAAMLDEFKKSGILENTFVIFMGDHGMRFGKIRATLSGYYEVRLPALYVSVPPKFKLQHPIEANNFEFNSRRMVTPYDMYLTIENILNLSIKNTFVSDGSGSCPNCQSLFAKVSNFRNCTDVNVDPFWCTCDEYTKLKDDNEMAHKSIEYFLGVHVEDILSKVNNKCRLCAPLKLSKVVSLYGFYERNNIEYYRSVFTVKPKDVRYEVLMSYDTIAKKFKVLGSDTFDFYSASCVDTFYLKKFCFCVTKKNHKSEYGKLCKGK